MCLPLYALLFMISLQSQEAAVGNPRSSHSAFNERHLILHACSGKARLIKVPLTVHVFCWQSLCHTSARREVLQRQSVRVLRVMSLLCYYCVFFSCHSNLCQRTNFYLRLCSLDGFQRSSSSSFSQNRDTSSQMTDG